MKDSLEDWKRIPSTTSVLFSIDLPYRPPKSPLGAFLWRWRIWIETTCGLSVLEPWEKILTLVVMSLLLVLVLTGVHKLIPQQGPRIYDRMLYYVSGNDEREVVAKSVRRFVTMWAARNVSMFVDAGEL